MRHYNFDNSHRSSGVSERTGSLSCSHDLAGRLTQIFGSAHTRNCSYDALNRLKTLKEGGVDTTTYAYDNLGNLQSVAYPNGVVHIYGYDNPEQMTSETIAGDPHRMKENVTYTYDPVGNRTQEGPRLPGCPGGLLDYNATLSTSYYAYDGDNLIEETNSSGAVVARYEDTQNIDEPLAMLRSSATSYVWCRLSD